MYYAHQIWRRRFFCLTVFLILGLAAFAMGLSSTRDGGKYRIRVAVLTLVTECIISCAENPEPDYDTCVQNCWSQASIPCSTDLDEGELDPKQHDDDLALAQGAANCGENVSRLGEKAGDVPYSRELSRL